jgi:hypothetical protein
MLLAHTVRLAKPRALLSEGISMAMSRAMMAMTTNSSIKVNARRRITHLLLGTSFSMDEQASRNAPRARIWRAAIAIKPTMGIVYAVGGARADSGENASCGRQTTTGKTAATSTCEAD